ncbi:MAG: M18 family aminopeptidase, partial [Spirochaetales bacterium]|nr:M18 family aminopeptidase [Spirochaetales bacterium]
MAVTDFVRFLDAGSSSAGVAHSITSRLRAVGFHRLMLGEQWRIEEKEAFFFEYGGTVIAYRAGSRPPSVAGMVLLAAHTDSPGLRLKHRSARYADGFARIPVEVYGGPILATWLDRDLAVVGSVVVDEGGGSTRVVPIDTKRPLAIIPNLAIHLNRDVNASATYNRQDHMQALF